MEPNVLQYTKGRNFARRYSAGSYLGHHGFAVILVIRMLFATAQASATEFYASPDGSLSGDGSMAQPWDLKTALNTPAILPGDTVWLRGGIYRESNRVTKFTSSLQGTLSQPVTVRQFAGERATIDGNIMQTQGGFVNYWGFEIMNSHTNRTTTEVGPFPTRFRLNYDGTITDLAVSGFDLRAPGVKLINLVIHDSIGGGIGVNTNGTNAEIYGNICYYNGWQGCDRGHGHGIYAQNVQPSTATLDENIFYGNYASGVQITGTDSLSDNFHLQGNIIFCNGAIARAHQANLLFGSFVGTSKDPVLIRNFLYDTQGSSDADANIGYTGGSTGAIVRSNYFQTSVHFSQSNVALTLENNTFLSNTVQLVRENYTNNLYIAGITQTNLIEVRTNKYEAGRANIIVYNWEHKATVSVDVSASLAPGVNFEIRNAQDFFGEPVLSGIYEGGVLELPMNGLSVRKPIGTNSPPSAAPDFAAFVLLPSMTEAPPNNTAPFISFIGDQVTTQNVPTEAAYFGVWDAETPFEYLNFSVHSSNPVLIPNANIILGGSSEFDRSIVLVPNRNEIGTATITLTVSDGWLATTVGFLLTVNPGEYLLPEGQKTNLQQGMIGLDIQTNQSAALQFHGNSGDSYSLQASDNLTDWDDIATLTADCGGLLEFVDTNASVHSARYYRMVLHPPIDVTP